jgi:hypothetical protein
LNFSAVPIEIEKCTKDRFKGLDKLGLYAGLYWCPKKVDFRVEGYMMGGSTKMLQIQVTYCDQAYLNISYPGKKCKNRTDINKEIAHA